VNITINHRAYRVVEIRGNVITDAKGTAEYWANGFLTPRLRNRP
jgi:hypothetical protein